MWARTLELGVRNLMLHKLRSFLTMLGTILGVGSVISMLAIGEGSKREAVEKIRKLGATNVIVQSIKPEQQNDEETTSGAQQDVSEVIEYGLRNKDLELMQATLNTVKKILPIALVRKNAQHGSHRIRNARVLGTTPDLLEVKHLSVRRGRFLTMTDLETTANVAVLSAGASIKLFSFEDPLGKSVLLGEGVYRVIGILNEQGGSGRPGEAGSDNANNFSDVLYIPLTAAQRRFGELQVILRAGSREFEKTQLHEITVTVRDENLVSQTAAMIRTLLERNHIRGDDYEIKVPLELLREAEQQKRIWNLVLGSIAGISLLVGGIGIMNIMLATVTERTREIGIRRALGATRRDITAQFLVETMVLSCAGGFLGIAVGVGLPLLVSMLSPIETVLSWWSIILAFGISAGTGVIFGIYPARRAAMMDPIEALRHE